MKIIRILFLIIFSPSIVHAHMEIYNDGPSFDAIGYGICDGSQNGEYDLIKEIVFSGAVIFDLGADIGSWSEAVLNKERNVILYAFEPIPSSYIKLKRKLFLPNCFVYNLAIADQINTKDFYIYANQKGATDCSSLYTRPIIQENYKELIKVKTCDLDSFCKEHHVSHIDFLKIDTEGAELSILKGAENLLSNKSIAVIQFEYGGTYPDAKITLKEVYNLLTSHSYSIYRLIPKGLIKIIQWRPELENFQYSNYVAILNK